MSQTSTTGAYRGASFYFGNIAQDKIMKPMAKKKTVAVELNRSSVDGKFVTAEYAKKHPKTTQTEHRKKKI